MRVLNNMTGGLSSQTVIMSVVVPLAGSVIGSAVSAGMGFVNDMTFLTAGAAGGYVEGQEIIEEAGLSFASNFTDFTLGAMTAGIGTMAFETTSTAASVAVKEIAAGAASTAAKQTASTATRMAAVSVGTSYAGTVVEVNLGRGGGT
ncbi:MAG: hypothetical protein LBK83_04175 [Treponema sp.]|jgi:hypothetical protein|nr:hypothetical protein [Treponema sp.]